MKISDAYAIKCKMMHRYECISIDEFEKRAAFLIGYRAWHTLLQDAEAKHYFHSSPDEQQTLFGSEIIFARDPDTFMMVLR